MRADLQHYCRVAVKVRNEEGQLVPFIWRRAQVEVHSKIERQRELTGRVRAIVLKGRKLGVSTYVGARFYHKTTLAPGRGQRTHIQTHEDPSTQVLFDIVKTIHRHMPGDYKLTAGRSNQTELNFPSIASGYVVSTAKNVSGVGRGSTPHNLHGCLAAGTQVVSGNGLRRIEDVVAGHTVTTHTGRFAPVSFVSTQVKPCKRVLLHGLRDYPLVATDEHRFWTKDGWAELSSLKTGDCIGYPIRSFANATGNLPFRRPLAVRPQGGGSQPNVPETIPLTYEVGRFLGYYLAEGCLKRTPLGDVGAIALSMDKSVVERTQKWIEPLEPFFSSATIRPREDSRTVVIEIYGSTLARFIRDFVGELSDKRFPIGWWRFGREFASGLLHGYIVGDGHFSPKRVRRISVTSIRSSLTIAARDALAMLGYGWASIEFKEAGVRHGRNEKEAFILRLCGPGVDALSHELGMPSVPRQREGACAVQITEGYAWIPIVEIEDVGERQVFDLEIAHENHSYCTIHGASHNSEVAFWPHSDVHFAGIVNAVPDAPRSEIIIESTANGLEGEFYEQWVKAEAGDSEYVPIFIPWWWHTDYRRPLTRDYEPSLEEEDYGRLYGLDDEQICWMHYKNITPLGGQPGKLGVKFKQEFPANPLEAFQGGAEDALISTELVMKARQNSLDADPYAARVLGVDMAQGGSDKTHLIDREGRRAGYLVNESFDNSDDDVTLAEKIARLIRFHGFQKVFIDMSPGKTVVDILHRAGFIDEVTGVAFGAKPTEEDKYMNKRAEMWGDMRDWLKDPGGVDVPDDNELHRHLCAPGYKYTDKSRILLEPKEKIRKRLKCSPDRGDALALTFAETVIKPIPREKSWMDDLHAEGTGGGFMVQ